LCYSLTCNSYITDTVDHCLITVETCLNEDKELDNLNIRLLCYSLTCNSYITDTVDHCHYHRNMSKWR
jgi:hypothetical protein